MNNANSLIRADENVQLNGPFDGAMSAAPTRGQLPRRQRRHHHRHQRRNNHRRPHQRHHHHHLRNNNNNHLHHHHHHHHHRHLPSHNGHSCHGQYQYSALHRQKGHEDQHDELEINEKRVQEMDENVEPMEKRPKVNPIFLWALQREQRIIEVRCEDYDKRNRIKLTKTPHGWRSIPRTSSNVYNLCCCTNTNCTSLTKDKTVSPSISSTCHSQSITSKNISASSESNLFTSKSELCNVKRQKNTNKRIQVTHYNEENVMKTKPQTRNSNYHLSNDEESVTIKNLCDKSQKNCDFSYIDNQHVDSDDVDYDGEDDYNDYEFDDNENEIEEQTEVVVNKTIDKNFKLINSNKKTFKFIDLEKVQKNQLLQPRVVLEPLNTLTILSNSLRERSRLDDEIEMIVEDEKIEVIQSDKMDEKLNYIEIKRNNLNEKSESLQYHYTKTEDSEDEITEIEDKDDEEEFIEENATVFQYEDRDSADMMDDDEFEEHDEILFKSNELLRPIVTKIDDTIEVEATRLKNNIIKQETNKLMDGSRSQVPDLKPIDNNLLKKPINKLAIENPQINRTSIERLLPSPPCSVTCSEDASRLHNNFNSTIISNRRRRQAPDLIEVKPTEWRRRAELLRPVHQLRDLIEKSGYTIPDPLLVPRDYLPALAASPGVEIPRLLVTRPELRLPEALTRPELLSDPDILVISLSHLQQVLETIPEPIMYKSKEKISGYELTNGTLMSSSLNYERKKLSVKPIGSLMPAPMDLSRNSTTVPSMENSIFLMRNKFAKQESEVSSTARLPGDDSRLWHPLFGCREKIISEDNTPRPALNIHANQDNLHHQCPLNYQPRVHQDTDHQHRASWHRTTLAS